MLLRKANLQDVHNNLANIFIDAFNLHLRCRPDIFGSSKSDEELKNELINIIENDNNIIVCEDDGIVVGYIMYKINAKKSKVLWIDQLAVDEDQRGKGIAKLLINKVRNLANEENCDRVELCCWDFNDNAMEMYKHLGFKTQRVIFEEWCNKDII